MGNTDFLYIAFIIYTYYRNFYLEKESKLELLNLKWVPFLKYFDVWIPLHFLIVQKYFRRKGRINLELELTKETAGFYEDTAKTFGREDKLRRIKFAETISQKINTTYTEKSFAIGIVATWGKGKTVFMNYLKNYLAETNKEFENSKNNILIEFNPWRSTSSKQILTDFFIELENELSQYDSKFTKLIQSYINSLNIVHSSEVTRAIKNTIESIEEDQSLRSKYIEINKAIRKLNKRLIIFIDDVDRLNKDEIKEVLRIIRNAADFSMTFFIVAYDHKYVQEALSESGNINKHYLDKIFQIQIPLPAFSPNVLFETFQSLIRVDEREANGDFEIRKATVALLGDKTEKVFTGTSSDNFLESYIYSLRDIVRFSNSFNMMYDAKREEVITYEFILLELLRLKYSQVFDFLGNSNNIRSSLVMDLKSATLTYDIESLFKSVEAFVEPDDKQILKSTLVQLFGTISKNTNARTIRHVNNHLLYFSFELHGKISLAELNRIRIAPNKESFFKRLDSWISEEETRNDLLTVLTRTVIFNSRIEFERTLEAYMYLSKYEDNLPNWRLTLFTIANKVNDITSKYYSTANSGIKEYSSFLKELFEEKSYSETFRSTLAADFLVLMRNNLTLNNLFSKDELEGIIFKIFREHLENNIGISQTTLTLYYNNFNQLSKGTNDIEGISKFANQQLINHIEKYPVDFINLLIVKSDEQTTEYPLYTFHPIVQFLFPDKYDDFEYFLEKLKSILRRQGRTTRKVLEAVSFLRKLRTNKFKPVYHTPNSIEFFSDESVTFISSPTYPDLIEKPCVPIDWHPWEPEILVDHPQFVGAKFVAHTDFVSRTEEIRGGTYLLSKTFSLIEFSESDIIKSVQLELFVDNTCIISINNRLTTEKIRTNHSDTGHTLYTIDISNFVHFDKENKIEFIVQNDAFKPKDITYPEVEHGKNNPYGIIFRIVVRFTDKIVRQ